jgi:hypothetical protein
MHVSSLLPSDLRAVETAISEKNPNPVELQYGMVDSHHRWWMLMTAFPLGLCLKGPPKALRAVCMTV